MNFTDLIQALSEAGDSDVPTSMKKAKALTGSIEERLEDLREWASELTELIDAVEETAGELADADRGEHEDAHTSWTEAVGQLSFHVREATAAPAPAGA